MMQAKWTRILLMFSLVWCVQTRGGEDTLEIFSAEFYEFLELVNEDEALWMMVTEEQPPTGISEGVPELEEESDE